MFLPEVLISKIVDIVGGVVGSPFRAIEFTNTIISAEPFVTRAVYGNSMDHVIHQAAVGGVADKAEV